MHAVIYHTCYVLNDARRERPFELHLADRYRARGIGIAAFTAIESRIVLALVLLSGGIILFFGALVLRPEEKHVTADAAALASGHAADEQGTEGTSTDTSEHLDTSEVTNTADSEHQQTEEDQTDSAHGEDHSDSVLGVEIESLNLASPQLTVVLIGLTLLLAVGLAIRWSVGLLVACVGLGVAGVVIGLREASHAGEELGIFVPLPVLAAILYAAASILAVLAVVRARTSSEDIHTAPTELATSPGSPIPKTSEGVENV